MPESGLAKILDKKQGVMMRKKGSAFAGAQKGVQVWNDFKCVLEEPVANFRPLVGGRPPWNNFGVRFLEQPGS